LLAFLAGRLISLLLTLFAASVVVFIVLRLLPGDPAAIILGVNARPDTIGALRHQLGLDRPIWIQFVGWIAGFVRGDLGSSYTYNVPVAMLVSERVAVSLPLACLAIVLSTAIAIPVGVLAAARHGRALDTLVMGVAQIGVAIPNFWLGLLLILLFGIRLHWFPASGFAGWEQGVWAGVRSLILPSLALALPQAAILARVTRTSVLETLSANFVRTARAKGLSPRAALWRHTVPNALIPVITIMGLQFSFLLAGTIIVENVFTLPGLGRLIFQAIAARDLIMVQDLVLLLAGSVVVVNFIVDLAYAMIDPRLARS
jgi:peptide/nickel transport system permease protein